jgi:hypothetical protein
MLHTRQRYARQPKIRNSKSTYARVLERYMYGLPHCGQMLVPLLPLNRIFRMLCNRAYAITRANAARPTLYRFRMSAIF